MDDLARRFINRFQGGFPLTEFPFTQAAEELGTSSAEFIPDNAAAKFRGGQVELIPQIPHQSIFNAVMVPIGRRPTASPWVARG